MAKRTLVSFDWAIKRLLRQKANFDILEGFLTELIGEDIVILHLLESESNKENEEDKYNRVDLMCENDRKELIIIEVQYYAEIDYFQRMLFGTSKVITEYMKEGDAYDKVRKVYSVNILYFDLGQGKDYVYRGKMEFSGIHMEDELLLSAHQQQIFNKIVPAELFPEYFIIKVNNFDDVAKNSLDEWIYYLKNTELPDRFKARGLKNVEERLMYDKMDTTTRQQYDQYLKDVKISKSMIDTAKLEGIIEGERKGKLEGKIEIILSSYDDGLDCTRIARITKLSEAEVMKILKEHGKM